MNNCAASSMSSLSTPEREVVGGGGRGEGERAGGRGRGEGEGGVGEGRGEGERGGGEGRGKGEGEIYSKGIALQVVTTSF